MRNSLLKRLMLTGLAVPILISAVFIALQFVHDPGSDTPAVAVTDVGRQIRQGQYLAQAGNCMACHTSRGGPAYAGGRRIETPFGALYSPNITPDASSGIGKWNADDFWRALHNGKSRDGHFLYPAFPYTEYTLMPRADSDALFAYFRTLAPVSRPNRAHALRFPYDQRPLLAGWRALYFTPGEFVPDPTRSVQWNRGAYLVQGPGHCSACHAARNALGASKHGSGLGGGLVPAQGWYAPSLAADGEAGLGTWSTSQITELLKTGVTAQASVFGPMAEVVAQSLQHLSDSDLAAMATYLKSLPPTAAERVGRETPREAVDEAVLTRGARLYADHCSSCHQDDGRGAAPAYPPLAGNRAITMASAINPIRIVLNGGFAPGTTGNPRPYGMPPYGPSLSDAEIAAIVTYIRNQWGNQAAAVSAQEVGRNRAVPID
ncbi:MAG: cytochrome c [Herminiimonas sp.]|nr:cytochrome c [Herminiimonas sp.]